MGLGVANNDGINSRCVWDDLCRGLPKCGDSEQEQRGRA